MSLRPPVLPCARVPWLGKQDTEGWQKIISFFPFPSFSAISSCSIWEEQNHKIFSPSSFLLKQACWLSSYLRGLRITVPSIAAGGGDSWDEELLTSHSQPKAVFSGGRGKHGRSHQLLRLHWPQNSRIKAQRAQKKFLTPFYAQSFLQLNNNRSLYSQLHHDFIFPSEVANCRFKKNIKNCYVFIQKTGSLGQRNKPLLAPGWSTGISLK